MFKAHRGWWFVTIIRVLDWLLSILWNRIKELLLRKKRNMVLQFIFYPFNQLQWSIITHSKYVTDFHWCHLATSKHVVNFTSNFGKANWNIFVLLQTLWILGGCTVFLWQHILRKQKTLYMTAVHWKTAMNMEKKIFMIFIFNISSGYLFFRWDKICKIIISIICKDEYIIFESLHEWFIQLQPNMNTIVWISKPSYQYHQPFRDM